MHRANPHRGRSTYLDFLIDTARMTVEVPRQKLCRVRGISMKFLESRYHKVREVASVVKKLVALEVGTSFKPIDSCGHLFGNNYYCRMHGGESIYRKIIKAGSSDN